MITGAAVTALFLAPAAIWGGQRIADYRVTKGTETVKASPQAQLDPQIELAEEKASAAASRSERRATPIHGEPRATITSVGDYAGMTPAELKKAQSAVTASRRAIPAAKMEEVSTIESVPRPLGEQGLTSQEQAKREISGEL